jgi:transcriptional regulator with XRE-family HTH domain
MGSAPTRPSRAVGHLLRTRRRALGLTLEQVSKKLVEDGHRVPVSSLSLIETGRSDPGVFRLHRLLHRAAERRLWGSRIYAHQHV